MHNLGPSLEDLLPKKNNTSTSDDDGTAGEKLEEKIKEITIKEKEQEVAQNAQLAGLPYINLFGFGISPDTIATIDEPTARDLRVICFLNTGSEVRLGTVDYSDRVQALEQELTNRYHSNVSTYLISLHSFESAIKLYETLPKIRKFIAGVEITEEELKGYEEEIKSFHDLNEKIKKTSITETVTLIVAGAIKSRASDIHIEAEEVDIKVRYRIDGVLNDAASIPKDLWPRIISRIKQLSKLKINITDKPQDGRFTIFLSSGKIDVRVSCLPTAYGESVVIRLLMGTGAQIGFEELGLRGQAYDVLMEEIQRPNGMIITTGPTGSGKTTSLYSVLKKLNDPETKIITIEDPIEYELAGVNQSQVKGDYSFAKALRSILRQDPDVIMVGEIRDLETAEIAIQAALTGHLVLSTIHTNDAFGAIPRFLSMGAKPFLLAPALNVSIGQRLVRRICESCKQETTLDEKTLAKVMQKIKEIPENSGYKVDESKLKFYKGGGCDVCQNIGYKGRVGIFEIIRITGEMEKAIIAGNLSEYEVKQMAVKDGVITMAQDGILKAIDGITTVDEVFRVAE